MRTDPSLFEFGRPSADVDVMCVDVDQVPGLELDVAAIEIRVALLSLLSRFHSGFGGLQVHAPVPYEGVDGERGVVITNRDKFICECDWSVGVATVDHVEWSETSSGGAVVVEREFRACEVSIPIRLVGCDVVADVGTDVAVRIFRLSVRL